MTDGAEVAAGRVLRSVGGVYTVEIQGRSVECAMRGRLKQEKGIGRVAVGDVVKLEKQEDGSYVVTSLEKRSSRLSRRTAHGRREQIIAANVDRLAAVTSVARPEPLFSLLDRLLVLAESNGITAFLVVNKTDLSSEAEARERFRMYESAGYEVLFTSVKANLEIDALRDHLAGHITLFVGLSGVGKSSLLNAVQPGLGLRVGEISKALQRGKHTTVSASLHPLDAGGYVVDTPGLGQLRFWEVGKESLAGCFPEFEAYLDGCRFDDCSHVHEPGCGVIEAVEGGKISRERYTSYLRMAEEA